MIHKELLNELNEMYYAIPYIRDYEILEMSDTTLQILIQNQDIDYYIYSWEELEDFVNKAPNDYPEYKLYLTYKRINAIEGYRIIRNESIGIEDDNTPFKILVRTTYGYFCCETYDEAIKRMEEYED